jgi:hypothetical protein
MRKNPAAVALGRRGGKAAAGKAIKALNARLTPEQRSESARRASLARWKKVELARNAAVDAIFDKALGDLKRGDVIDFADLDDFGNDSDGEPCDDAICEYCDKDALHCECEWA